MSNYIFPDGRYGEAAEAAYNEIKKAKEKHGPKDFNSIHEGFGVLQEEVDELWDEIRKDNIERAVEEAVQVAAMALRFVAEFGVYPYRPCPPIPKKSTVGLGEVVGESEIPVLDLNGIRKLLLENSQSFTNPFDLVQLITAPTEEELRRTLHRIFVEKQNKQLHEIHIGQ